MKRELLLVGIFFLAGCTDPVPDYVSLSGTIVNSGIDSIQISSDRYTKTIILGPEGSFRDTLKVEKGYYTLSLGEHTTQVFLKNGYDLRMKANADSFYRTVSYEGRGSDNSNYIAEKIAFVEHRIGDPKDYFTLEKEQFDTKVANLEDTLRSMFEGREQLDSALVAREKAINRRWIGYLTSNYRQQHELYSGLQKGKPSPTFKNYENHAGGTTSFEELTGNYIYFTVWATDCVPCRKEFPALKELRQKYSDDNITFVGISVDEKENRDRWRQMVDKLEPGGIQLHTGAGYYRKFVRDYNITRAPRYLLVDPEGNIVTAFAPAPSDPDLEQLFMRSGIGN